MLKLKLHKLLWLLPALLLAAAAAHAQTTTVSIVALKDPNGVPYSNATVVANLTPATGNINTPVINGLPFPHTVYGQLNGAGTLITPMVVGTNSFMQPPNGYQWVFTVNLIPGVPLPFGTGPQQFSDTITISGSTQNITTTLAASAPALTVTFSSSGGGTPCTTTALSMQYNNAGAFGCEPDFIFTAPHTLALGASAVFTLGQLTPSELILTDSSKNMVSGTALPNGTTATTQTVGDNTTKAATDAFVLANSATNPMTTLGDDTYGGASGVFTRLAGPTAAGTYYKVEKPSSGAATAQIYSLAGVVPNPQTGTTYTYLQTDSVADRAGYTSFSNASAIAVTLPQAGSTGFGSNWVNSSCNIGAGTTTITPTTSTISYSTGSAYTSAASTMTLTTGQCAFIYSDNTNYFAIKFAASSAGANTALSNLASVAVNTALLPGTDNSIALDSASFRYTTGYFSTSVVLGTGCTIASGGYQCISGSSSGTITDAVQAAAGTYNWNRPITAGTSGQALLSAGGGSSPMTWGTVPTTTTGVQGEPAVYPSATAAIVPSPAYLDVTQFPASDPSVSIGLCLVALYTISPNGGTCDARGLPSGGEWGSNPFGYAGLPGANYPWTGTLLLCGQGTIQVDVPIVKGNYWSIQGCGTGQGAGGHSVTFQANAAKFQSTYTTGTITVGTPGQVEVITGSGTTWAAKMVGCDFVSPATQPTVANSTFGIISNVTSTTSITLGFGVNNGTGAPGGSTYAIYCPVLATGDGNQASVPYEYAGDVSHFAIDCNNVAGCIDFENWFSEEGSTASDLELIGYTNIGFDRETNYAQNSGPYDSLTFFPGSSCTAATISYVSRAGAVAMKPLQNSSLNNPTCATRITEAADIQTSAETLENLHIENATRGISVGFNTSCPIACPGRPAQVAGFLAENINAAIGGTSVIAFSNAIGNVLAATLHNITISGGASWTNTLADTQNSCTDNSQRIGTYELFTNGGIEDSTSAVYPGCLAQPTFNTTQLFPTGKASAGTNFNSYYLQWFGSYGSNTNDQSGCLMVDPTGATPASFMNCTHISGSTNFVGWSFDRLLIPGTIYSAAGTALPTCNGATNGDRGTVSDATAPLLTTYVSGGGLTAPVVCAYNGSSYAWVTLGGPGGPYATALSSAVGTATYTVGSGVTSVVCTSGYLCNNTRGTLTIVGGTATTGTIATVNFSTTLSAAPACFADMNGGGTLFNIGNSAPTTGAFNITAAISVIGATFNVNYWCQP